MKNPKQKNLNLQIELLTISKKRLEEQKNKLEQLEKKVSFLFNESSKHCLSGCN